MGFLFTRTDGRSVTVRTAHDARIAKSLGVSFSGLKCLAMAVANGGELKKTFGTASVALERQGHVIRHPGAAAGRYGHHTITDSGREIVRRARELGW